MTTIVSYNILAGGYNVRNNSTRRTEQLAAIIRSAQPDIVGLVEATHPLHAPKTTRLLRNLRRYSACSLLWEHQPSNRMDIDWLYLPACQ